MIDHIFHIRTLILLIIGLVILFLTLRSLRAQRLKERYVLLFLITGVPFLLLAMWPDAVVAISEFLEIEKPTLLVLCVAVYFILTTFELLSIVSVQSRNINALGQHMGILMEEHRKLRDLVDAEWRTADGEEDAPPGSIRHAPSAIRHSPPPHA
ncbi:MAG: DUF2304 family protein [Phycisphaeraceae bacterium]